MFFDPFYLFLVILPSLVLGIGAQIMVKSAYARAGRIPARSGLTGAQAAARILEMNGLDQVGIEPVRSFLGDHYDPRHKVLRLSPEVYNGRSLAALGVAAHEAGHALQDRVGYAPLALRNGIVPLANFGSNTAIIILEDDAQAGCDHVNSQRSIGFFISKYNQGSTQKPNVDSRFLTTVSALSTIETLLGLSPNNLMTATAPLMFTELQRASTMWHGAYKADFSNLENGQIFEEATGKIRENPIMKELADLTGTLEMEEADEADANTLNYVLERWVSTQGRLNCCK